MHAPKLIEEAKAIEKRMQNDHGMSQLSDECLFSLARQLYRLQERSTLNVIRQSKPSDKEILKKMAELEGILGRLSKFAEDQRAIATQVKVLLPEYRLDESDHPVHLLKDKLSVQISVRGWMKASTEIYEAVKQLRQKAQADPDSLDTLGDIISSLVSESQGKHKWKTELAGNKLPSLFARYYPGASFGGRQFGEALEGPGYTFVAEALKQIGYKQTSAEAIKKARMRVGGQQSGKK